MSRERDYEARRRGSSARRSRARETNPSRSVPAAEPPGTDRSDALEVALPLPVGDGLLPGFPLGAVEVRVVLDDVRAEGLARERALLEERERVAQAPGHARQLGRGVEVA